MRETGRGSRELFLFLFLLLVREAGWESLWEALVFVFVCKLQGAESLLESLILIYAFAFVFVFNFVCDLQVRGRDGVAPGSSYFRLCFC